MLRVRGGFPLVLWVPSDVPAALPFTSGCMAVIPINKTQWMRCKGAEIKIALANSSSAFRKINLSEVREKLEKPPFTFECTYSFGADCCSSGAL